jgi:hypothetical protein
MVVLWNMMIFDVYIIVDLEVIWQQSPYFPKNPLFFPSLTWYTCWFIPAACWITAHAGLESGEPLPVQVWESKSSLSLPDQVGFATWWRAGHGFPVGSCCQLLGIWNNCQQSPSVSLMLPRGVNLKLDDVWVSLWYRWCEIWNLMSKDLNHEGGLGWRDCFVLSGSMCFEKIIIFLYYVLLIMCDCYRTGLNESWWNSWDGDALLPGILNSWN